MKHRLGLILLLILMVGCSAEPSSVPITSQEPAITSSPIPVTLTLTPSPLPPTDTPLPPSLTSTPEPYPLPNPEDVLGVITVWYAYTSAATGEYRAIADLVLLANTKFPNLVVKTVQVPFGEIFTKFRNEASMGNGPDILLAPNDQLGSMARDQLILQLDPYVQGHVGDISPMGIGGMQVDGKLYGIPESSKVVALYYKKSMVENPPATTEELLGLVREGKLLVNHLDSYFLYGWANAFGGQLFDEKNRCIADQGGWEEALNYLLELKEVGAIFDTDYGGVERQFLRGGAAMYINGSWNLRDYQKVFGKNLGVIMMPSGPGGPANPFVGVDGFYVNRFSQNKEAAISLALFMASQESEQIFTDRGGHIPVHDGVTINDQLLSAFSQAVDTGTIRPQGREFDNYWGPFREMFIAVLENGVSPDDAVATACSKMNRANGK